MCVVSIFTDWCGCSCSSSQLYVYTNNVLHKLCYVLSFTLKLRCGKDWNMHLPAFLLQLVDCGPVYGLEIINPFWQYYSE